MIDEYKRKNWIFSMFKKILPLLILCFVVPAIGATIENFDDQNAQGFFENDVYASLFGGGPYATFVFNELVLGSGDFFYRIDADSPDSFPSTASAGVDGFIHSDYTVTVNVTQWNADTAFVIGGFINFDSGYVFACVSNACQLVRLDGFVENQLAVIPGLSLNPSHVYRMEISRGGNGLDEHRGALYNLTTGGNLIAELQATDSTYAANTANPVMAVQALSGPADSPYVVAYFDNFIAYDSDNAINVPIAGWLAQALLALALCGSVAVWRHRRN
ncbi:MAG: hypothetical protein EX270_02235 [Pseudomonadales bacterium]|nr:hypothetical protein [Pseudomonadales bacterium]RZV58833.1 MAG: hypothetical protein EX270_02235 [Pseudomonadales bacterium]